MYEYSTPHTYFMLGILCGQWTQLKIPKSITALNGIKF